MNWTPEEYRERTGVLTFAGFLLYQREVNELAAFLRRVLPPTGHQ